MAEPPNALTLVLFLERKSSGMYDALAAKGWHSLRRKFVNDIRPTPRCAFES